MQTGTRGGIGHILDADGAEICAIEPPVVGYDAIFIRKGMKAYPDASFPPRGIGFRPLINA